MGTFKDIINDIDNKKYYPIYFLFGQEEFYIDKITEHIENNILDETEKEFNQSILYGKDIDQDIIINHVRRFPMMAEHQVVIIKEAQSIKDFDKIALYLKNPLHTTLLVICYKYRKIDKRTTFAKLITKKGVLFESKPLYDNQVPEWIKNYITEKSYRINSNAVSLLAESLGSNLGKIVNEVNKLFINLPKGSLIDEDIIEKNIGISKDFNAFELTKALGKRDTTKAFQIAQYFADNPKEHPIIMSIPVIFNYFIRMLTFKQLRDKSLAKREMGLNYYSQKEIEFAARQYSYVEALKVISLCKEYDLKSKGVNNQSATHGELLKELIIKIFVTNQCA